jgi:hypothetical protein
MSSSVRHRGAASVELFDRAEAAYLEWVDTHPDGYVANVDRKAVVPEYPMLHRATHAAVFSDRIGNFTTGDYMKYCSTDLDTLETWVSAVCGRPSTRCKQCM